MILVTTGTHAQPFDRLVRSAEAVARATGERVVVQRGPSREPAPHCEVHDILPHGLLLELVREARVVVTHAGPATLFEVLGEGKVPLVVPRDPAYGEHVDRHQQDFAALVAHRVHVVRDPERLAVALARHDQVVGYRSRPPGRDRERREATRRFAALVEEVLSRPRRRERWRATMTSLFRKVTSRP